MALSLRVDDTQDVPAVTRDPDADYLIALAHTTAADVLVTGDTDLLEAQHSDVEVISPRQFVERLDEGTVSPTV